MCSKKSPLEALLIQEVSEIKALFILAPKLLSIYHHLNHKKN
ncbi:hypothetical protein LOK49_LG01G04002 [Camellia lanceoleosa]|uniref:Uncharacterized protein n=1 Tax=Camellia lanceoleosa TaxID=1840588 RepID=A0ACC0J6J0_9ERIC|nr:hypothetical protein LOK49_LG01G04002 [Camellia lanceoleosa]